MEIKAGDVVSIKKQKGSHTVLQPGPQTGLTQVRDDHGNEFWVPTERVQLPLPKPEKKQGRVRVARHINVVDQIAIDEVFISHLRRGCFISGNGRERDKVPFLVRYEEVTGHTLNGGGQHMSWSCPEETFTYALRVYFEAPENLSLLPPRAHRRYGMVGYELCDTNFCFELLRLGFDLGWNGPATEAAA